jgi:hypothetical protein
MVQKPMIRPFSATFFFAAATSLALCSCSLIRSVPIPFSGGGSGSDSDPKLAYSPSTPLRYGHTLDVSVYQGLRSPSRIYHDEVMVDEHGMLNLGNSRKVKVDGLSAVAAVKSIEGAFRTEAADGIVQVHINSIEDVPTLTITGGVRNPAVIQWFSGANLSSILPYVGGRDPRSSGRSVYVTHRGKRHFHADTIGLGNTIQLEPGDIIHFSEDL